jgi:hypothetical protein
LSREGEKMTAEIAIMNKQAIAMAADSAVTLEDATMGHKISPSAQKIFTLSKYHPVGVMVYGSAEFLNIPWETIIKVYRSSIGNKQYETLNLYADDFLQFMRNNKRLFNRDMQSNFAKGDIVAYLGFLKGKILDNIKLFIDANGKASSTQIEYIVKKCIQDNYSLWTKATIIGKRRLTTSFVVNKYGKFINKAIKEIFQNLPINPQIRKSIFYIITCAFFKIPKEITPPRSSGVVIAGFGKKEIFPSLLSYKLYGLAEGILRYEAEDDATIAIDNDAAIVPFAQREMVDTFMEGIDPFLKRALEKDMMEIIVNYPDVILDNIKTVHGPMKQALLEKFKKVSAQALRSYKNKFEKYVTDKYVHPILKVVSFLPKNELAAMAESFVTLTSFKRKVSMQRETVGGPIDVAVISKGDGFIWIKRKHYFTPEMNMGFLKNYYREE